MGKISPPLKIRRYDGAQFSGAGGGGGGGSAVCQTLKTGRLEDIFSPGSDSLNKLKTIIAFLRGMERARGW